MTSKYERAYPELFAPLPAQRRVSVARALASGELDCGEPTYEEIALLIRGITENMSDADYIAAAVAAATNGR